MEDDDLDAEGLSPLQAYGAVRRFAQRSGALPLRLALHAALPQVLHADLLHLLRLNFVDDGLANPVAEADVLFASFCSDLGHAYFRFDAHARALLLAELDGAYAGERRHRSLQVADFLLAWFDRELARERAGTDAMYCSWIEVERWNALAFADPDGAAEQLAAVLQQATGPEQAAARLRVGTLARSLAQPLVKHQPLLDYAAGVQALEADAHETAQALLRRLGDRPVEVGAVRLPPPSQVLAARAPPAVPAPPTAVADVPPPKPAPRAPARPAPPGNGYSAYLSCAHADDQRWNGWIGDFARELDRGLRAVLRGLPVRPLHLSIDSRPAAGMLDDELRARVEASFAMIVLVGDAYVQSAWGLREVEFFAQRFGPQALRERLYVVALSEPAMRELQAKPAWQRLGLGEHAWLPFYDPDSAEVPLPVYLERQLVSPQFRDPFDRLRSDLAAKLRRAANEAAEAPPPVAAPGRTEVAVGYLAGAGSARLPTPAIGQLEALGLRVLMVSQVDVAVRGHPALARARQLVLPFDNQPLDARGGHLATFRDAWRALGRDDSGITWLDLRTPEDSRSSAGAALWVESQGVPVLRLDGWMGSLRNGEPAPQGPAVCVYVESNAREPDHWQALADVLRQRWDAISRQLAQSPAVALRVRGLPVDHIEQFPTLDDADGVMLLWGRKTSDALVAQINRVENRMSPGSDAPPGLVAYLMPPQPTSSRVPAWGWPVVRFNVAGGGAEVAVVDDDAVELDEFLKHALECRLRRPGGSA